MADDIEDRMRRRARAMRRVNVPMRWLLRIPFRTPLSKRLMLARFTGRISGRHYCQPVSYVRDGDSLLTPGGGKWTRNLRDGEPLLLVFRGRQLRAHPILIRDPDEVIGALRYMLTANSRLTSFVPFIDADGAIDRAKLDQALAHGFCIVRWVFEGPGTAQDSPTRRDTIDHV